MLDEILNDPRVTWIEDVLRFGDTDAIGHINNATFSVFCESGRVSFFNAKLIPVRQEGAYFVIARLTINFKAELHYPGRVRTGTWVTRMGSSSITLEQVILCEDRLAATAESVCVRMEEATRRPRAYDDDTRRVAARFTRPSFEEAKR